jgi:hypothetical protein
MIKKILCHAFILFFTTQSDLFAQSTSGNEQSHSTTLSSSNGVQPNRQYFLVFTQRGSLKGLSSSIKSAFPTKQFISVEIDEINSMFKIVSSKGTKIEDVKAVLVGFNLNIVDYQEQYSNSTPVFFTTPNMLQH